MIEFFKEIELPKLKKTDWIALALTGAILLIIALPQKKENEVTKAEEIVREEVAPSGSNSQQESYISYLENRLEEVLGQMEGVGKVKVMITVSDTGETVVEKDIRTTIDSETQEETVVVEDNTGSYPYVGKKIMPSIEGIVVVAEGGGNATVAANISNAAMALFPVEAHKIIVVKMSSKGD